MVFYLVGTAVVDFVEPAADMSVIDCAHRYLPSPH